MSVPLHELCPAVGHPKLRSPELRLTLPVAMLADVRRSCRATLVAVASELAPVDDPAIPRFTSSEALAVDTAADEMTIGPLIERLTDAVATPAVVGASARLTIAVAVSLDTPATLPASARLTFAATVAEPTPADVGLSVRAILVATVPLATPALVGASPRLTLTVADAEDVPADVGAMPTARRNVSAPVDTAADDAVSLRATLTAAESLDTAAEDPGTDRVMLSGVVPAAGPLTPPVVHFQYTLSGKSTPWTFAFTH
jgi:hypothetical protein